MMLLRALVVPLAGCVVALASGCAGNPPGPSPSVAPSGLHPRRPVVSLGYELADDLRSASGTERVMFTPDQRICEIVWRAWPNKPTTAQAGNSLTVSSVSMDGQPLAIVVEKAGAPSGSPGTLIRAALPACVDAGRAITLDVRFALTLGRDTDERVGYANKPRLAWFASAFPMLAYVRGSGWQTDAAVAIPAESATSEMFRLDDLTVDAPAADEVAGTGAVGTVETKGARRVHHFSADALRDVSVEVGALKIETHEIHGVRVHLALPASKDGRRGSWQASIDRSLNDLVAYLGDFPFPDLWVQMVPGASEGIESTGAVQMGDLSGGSRDHWLFTHELAHQWFYGLVGNNQARDPWLDEAFASMVQQVVDDPQHAPKKEGVKASVRAQMALPVSAFTKSDAYVAAVYEGGADVLLDARTQAGPRAFDEALRRYVRANAYTVATPARVQAAFAGLPKATAVLQAAHAF